MPWVDYNAVQDEIVNILDSNTDMFGVTVEKEKEFPFEGYVGDWVGVYFDKRIVPPVENQVISGGTVLMIELQYSIWCASASIDPDEAYINRNKLLAKVEKILMENLNLNDQFNVQLSFLFGGEIISIKDATDYGIGLGEIIFSVMVKATTT